MPPHTIAPRRPLPNGNASTHCVAGLRYQSLSASVPASAPSPGTASACTGNGARPESAIPAPAALNNSRRLRSMLIALVDSFFCNTRHGRAAHGGRLPVVLHGGIDCRFQYADVLARTADPAH